MKIYSHHLLKIPRNRQCCETIFLVEIAFLLFDVSENKMWRSISYIDVVDECWRHKVLMTAQRFLLTLLNGAIGPQFVRFQSFKLTLSSLMRSLISSLFAESYNFSFSSWVYKPVLCSINFEYWTSSYLFELHYHKLKIILWYLLKLHLWCQDCINIMELGTRPIISKESNIPDIGNSCRNRLHMAQSVSKCLKGGGWFRSLWSSI